MDEVLIDREGVDKLQQLLPTQEELKVIAEHQELNKELPLGNCSPSISIVNNLLDFQGRQSSFCKFLALFQILMQDLNFGHLKQILKLWRRKFMSH